MDRLSAEVAAVNGRVYDRATETDEFPYITLGPSYWADESAECIEARNMTVQIDVFCESGAGAGKGNAEDVVDDVAAALKGWADTDALTMHPLRVTLVRVMDDPSGCVHGVVQVEAMVEAG
ncbi:DUF3168 domain-containing protein [Paracoccus sp. (in: a-proteobacteria)]|uniref:DUF3168 domain-containing protein n=1 Tax=Paracoccus sp. TaxID=267 RepID=UPI0028AF5785|nr:DUF3168 domain-containing protein [Paracoccus sp. (in: a-proteobacteria)]